MNVAADDHLLREVADKPTIIEALRLPRNTLKHGVLHIQP
jgi:hypothetical protein